MVVADMVTKAELIDMLQEGVVNVVFTKKDGTQRLMKCTLDTGIAIPHEKKTDREKKVNENILAVWDIESSGWRSFNLNSIIDVYK